MEVIFNIEETHLFIDLCFEFFTFLHGFDDLYLEDVKWIYDKCCEIRKIEKKRKEKVEEGWILNRILGQFCSQCMN